MTNLAPRGYSAYGTAIDGEDGATIGTANFFGEIIEMGELEETREDIEITNSASPDNRAQFVPSDIITGGEYQVKLLHDPQKPPPFGDVEDITITLPLRGDAVTAAKKVFPGYMKKHGVSFPLKDKMVTTVVLKVAGKITHTAAAGA